MIPYPNVVYHLYTSSSVLRYERNTACRERSNGTVVPRKTNLRDEVAASAKPHLEQQAASA